MSWGWRFCWPAIPARRWPGAAQDRLDQENAFLAANDAARLSPLDSRKGSRQLEEMYGKSGVVAAGLMESAERFDAGQGLGQNSYRSFIGHGHRLFYRGRKKIKN